MISIATTSRFLIWLMSSTPSEASIYRRTKKTKRFNLEGFAAKYDADYKPNSYGWSEWLDRQEIIREVAAQSRAAWLAGSTLSHVRSSWENPATVDVEQTHEKRENVRRQLAPLKARDKYPQSWLPRSKTSPKRRTTRSHG